jgi:DNA polymerase-3 subunit gamma/tau
VFAAVDRVIEAGLDPRRFAQDLLERFRDLLVLDAVPDATDAGLIDAPTDALERMRNQATHLGRAALSHAADVMATALVDMRGTTSPRLVLELACARVLLPAAADDTAALLSRLDRLEKRLAATVAPTSPAQPAPSAPTQSSSPEPPARAEKPKPAEQVADGDPARPSADETATAAPAAAEPSAPAGGVVDLAALRRLWDSVLDAVKSQSRTAHALMMSSQIESLDGNNLVLAFSSASLATRFAADVAPTLTVALKEVVGVDLRVSATSGGNPPRPAPTAPDRPPAAEPAAEMSADDIEDSDDLDGSTESDPEATALALLQDGLGAEVIGEINQG